MGLFGWLLAKGASRRAVAQMAASIDDGRWREQTAAMPFLRGLEADELQRLRSRCAWFLASKTFDGAGGLQVTDTMALCIAIQATLPILNLGTSWYEGWTGIVVYPGAFVAPHAVVDDSGVVHRLREPRMGEAWDGGPVVLSWEDAQPCHAGGAVNVVIHEFAHKLDMAHGPANGMPHLGGSGIDPAQWLAVLERAWHRLERSVELLESAIGPDVDPESDAAQRLYDSLPMDAYGASDPAEFFAVSSEVFFVDPARLHGWQPQWYALLARFYRQDPLARLGFGPSV